MVKNWIYYEDGNFELIKCPECLIDDISHVHTPGQYEGMICNQCSTRFNIEERKEKIIKIRSENDVEECEGDGGLGGRDCGCVFVCTVWARGIAGIAAAPADDDPSADRANSRRVAGTRSGNSPLGAGAGQVVYPPLVDTRSPLHHL